MAVQWSSLCFRFVFLLQFMFCVHLYLNQISLVSKFDLLHNPCAVLERSKRELQAFSNEYYDEADSRENNSMELSTTAAATTTTTTTSTTAKSYVNARGSNKRHHRKSQRLPVERYLVSSESTTAAPIMVRPSRTKTTSRKKNKVRQDHRNTHFEFEDESHIFNHKSSGSGEFLELSRPPTTILPAVPQFSPAAIHYVGDISNVTKARHEHYTGNGRIKISGIYSEWRPAQWTNLLPASQHFSMKRGKVSVLRGGLYLLYAQIHYANTQEMNCFRALHNEVVVAQCCSTTSHPDRHEVKANTCSLLTTVYLLPGDQVWLSDVHERFVILTEEKSYFGMVQLVPAPKP